MNRDAEIERAARAIDDAWVEGDFDSRAYATAAITPLLDRIDRYETALKHIATALVPDNRLAQIMQDFARNALAQSQPGVKP